MSNNEESIKGPAGEFLIKQRNAGYEPNDGRWVVSLLPELYWSGIGVLRQKRPGVFVGIAETREAALEMIESTPLPEIVDKMVESMGRVSC